MSDSDGVIHGGLEHRQSSHKLIGIIAGTFVVAAILAAVIYFGFIRSSTKKPVSNSESSSQMVSPVNAVSLPAASTQYYSNNLSLGFNYPKSWAISDVLGSNQITAISPVTQLVDSNDHTSLGKVILTIINTPPPPVLAAFKSGSAIAVLPSQIITYTNPTPDQKATSYISFLHYASSTTPLTTIDGIYITGNAGYQVNQYSPQTDILAVSPIVYFSFERCATSACSTTTPLSLPSAIWENKAFSQPILSMLESLSIT